MLDEGAGARDALQIADGIDYLGASLSTSSTFDAAFVELHVPVARLGNALPIMADVALRPTFPEKELQRVREELLTSIVQAQDDPEALVQFAFPRLVFGPEHRYGTMSFGTAASVKSFTVADLRQFHAASLRPVERGAHRDRRRHGGLRRRATGIRVRRLEGDGSRRRSCTAGAAVDLAQGVPDRQAGRRAVANPGRLGRRAAIHARLLRASRPEYRARRGLHVAAQSEPARGARLRVRRELRVRHARLSRTVLTPKRPCRPTRPRRR